MLLNNSYLCYVVICLCSVCNNIIYIHTMINYQCCLHTVTRTCVYTYRIHSNYDRTNSYNHIYIYVCVYESSIDHGCCLISVPSTQLSHHPPALRRTTRVCRSIISIIIYNLKLLPLTHPVGTIPPFRW